MEDSGAWVGEIWKDISQDNWIEKCPLCDFVLLLVSSWGIVRFVSSSSLKKDSKGRRSREEKANFPPKAHPISDYMIKFFSLFSIIQTGNEHRTYCRLRTFFLFFFVSHSGKEERRWNGKKDIKSLLLLRHEHNNLKLKKHDIGCLKRTF